MAAIYIGVEEPEFESQTKIKLGSRNMSPKGDVSVAKFVGDFVKKEVNNYLHKTPDTADALRKIQESEKERKAIAGVAKLARERARRRTYTTASCATAHPPQRRQRAKTDRAASSSPRATRPADRSPRAATRTCKPSSASAASRLNCFGLTKKIVYENEEFNLLQPRSTSRTASTDCATTASSSPPMPTWTACTFACC